MGRAALGVSTALAVVGAIGLGVATNTSEPIQVPSIGVCGSPPDSAAAHFRSMAASFVIKNTSGSPVTIRGLRATMLVGLASARVTIKAGADADEIRHYRLEATVAVSSSEVAKSSPVAPDGSTTIAAHSFATVITSMTLADGAMAGRATDFQLATTGALGTIRTQTIPASVGLGVDGAACTALDQ